MGEMPRKKQVNEITNYGCPSCGQPYNRDVFGYNQACDDWRKFILEELEDIGKTTVYDDIDNLIERLREEK